MTDEQSLELLRVIYRLSKLPWPYPKDGQITPHVTHALLVVRDVAKRGIERYEEHQAKALKRFQIRETRERDRRAAGER